MSYIPEKTIYLCLAHMSEDGIEQKYVKEAFDTNWVVPLGPNVNAFEEDLKNFVGGKNEVVALSAGTAAVHLALIGCGVQAGDEVLVQSFTFCASSHPVTYLGAKPVFVGSEKIRGIWTRCCWRKLSKTVWRKRERSPRRLFRWRSTVCHTTVRELWRLQTAMTFLWWRMRRKGSVPSSTAGCWALSASLACCHSTAIR